MYEEKQESNRTETDGATEAKLFFGRVFCVLGLVLLLPGAYFVSVAVEFVTLCFGIVGYYLGARSLGIAVAALSIVAALVGLLVGQGYIVNPFEFDVADGLRRGMEAITGE